MLGPRRMRFSLGFGSYSLTFKSKPTANNKYSCRGCYFLKADECRLPPVIRKQLDDKGITSDCRDGDCNLYKFIWVQE